MRWRLKIRCLKIFSVTYVRHYAFLVVCGSNRSVSIDLDVQATPHKVIQTKLQTAIWMKVFQFHWPRFCKCDACFVVEIVRSVCKQNIDALWKKLLDTYFRTMQSKNKDCKIFMDSTKIKTPRHLVQLYQALIICCLCNVVLVVIEILNVWVGHCNQSKVNGWTVITCSHYQQEEAYISCFKTSQWQRE